MALDPHPCLITHQILAIWGDPDVVVRADGVRAIEGIGVGPSAQVLPVVEIDRRLHPVADQHVAAARVQPVQCAAQGVERRGGGEIEGIGPGAAGPERHLTNLVAAQVIEHVGIHRVEPNIGRRRPKRDAGMRDPAGCHLDDFREM